MTGMLFWSVELPHKLISLTYGRFVQKGLLSYAGRVEFRDLMWDLVDGRVFLKNVRKVVTKLDGGVTLHF